MPCKHFYPEFHHFLLPCSLKDEAYEPHPFGVQSFGEDLKKLWKTFQESTQFFKHGREFLFDFDDQKAVLRKPHSNIPDTHSYDGVFSGLLKLVVISTFWGKGPLWIFPECHLKVRAHVSQPLVYNIEVCRASSFQVANVSVVSR